MSDSVRPHRRQPTRLRHPWDSPGKNTGVGCHFLLQCMKGKSQSEVAQRVRLCATPWTAAHQAPPSMGFSRQEYWSGCHCLLYPLLVSEFAYYLSSVYLRFCYFLWVMEGSTDGRVAGWMLIFSCENTKIATSSWATINRRILDPTKKRYPVSKGKGEAPTRW